jgi:outer membrane PBP1 activator LpoA protein
MMRHLTLFLSAALGLSLLTSCQNNLSSSAGENPNYQKLSLDTVERQTFVSAEDLDTLFMQTRYVDQADKNRLYLTISRRLTKDSQYALAQILLDKIDQLSPDEYAEKYALLAQQNLSLRQHTKAHQALMRLQQGTTVDPVRYRLLLSWYLYERGSYTSYLLNSSETYRLAAGRPELQRAILDTTWRSLQLANSAQINQLSAHPDPTIQGWLSLRAIIDPQNNPKMISAPADTIALLREWRATHSDHPAKALIKNSIDQDSYKASPKKIGLMLPITGKNQKAAQLIQKALFATYFQTRPTNQTLSIYDTNRKNAATLYSEATQNDRVDTVIGPLTKPDIESLVNTQSLTVPTLVLNRAPATSQQLTQYSLSAAQETGQLTGDMILSGYLHPLVISDETAQSQALAHDFMAAFEQHGGIVAQSEPLHGDLNRAIAKALGTSASAARHRQIQAKSIEPTHTIHNKRRDIDSIFFAGDAKQARQLIPLLKYHYSAELPIFSTSSIYSSDSRQKNKDLSSAIFFDTPLSHTQNGGPALGALTQSLMKKMHQNDPNHYFEHHRFYGLGVDAYLIAQTGYLWDMLDGYVIQGANGTLTKDANGIIHRGLSRMAFKDGIVVIDKRYHPVREQWRSLAHLSLL